jgi:hypothetical protein
MGEIIGLPVNEPERYVDVRRAPVGEGRAAADP